MGEREIVCSEYSEAVERNKHNYECNPELYRKRQEINEHIFGTIKRQWNLYYTNLRGLESKRRVGTHHDSLQYKTSQKYLRL